MVTCASLGLESVCNEYEFISQFWTTCNYYLSLICETSNSSDFIYYTYCLTAIMCDSYQDINQPVLYTVLLANATTNQFNPWDLSGFKPHWRPLQPPPLFSPLFTCYPVPKLISKRDKSEIIFVRPCMKERRANWYLTCILPQLAFPLQPHPLLTRPFICLSRDHVKLYIYLYHYK